MSPEQESAHQGIYFWCRFSDAYQGTPCDHEECKIYLLAPFNLQGPQDASEELGNAEGSPYEQKSQQDPSEAEEHWKECQAEQKYSEGE